MHTRLLLTLLVTFVPLFSVLSGPDFAPAARADEFGPWLGTVSIIQESTEAGFFRRKSIQTTQSANSLTNIFTEEATVNCLLNSRLGNIQSYRYEVSAQ